VIFNIIVIAIVAYLGYHWSRFGVFPAFLHLLCTVVAGAIAFAVWEPLALLLLDTIPPTGGAQFLENVVWPASLLVPFGVGILLLRAAIDAAVPETVKNPGAFDMAGGALLGAISAYIAVGVLAIGFGFLRTGGVLGYQPAAFDTSGSVVRQGYLWIQADRAASTLFEHLSQTSLRSGTPLAEAYPNLVTSAYAHQLSHGQGKARTVIRPEDFDVTQAYVVGDPSGAPARELLAYEGGGAQQHLGVDRRPTTSGQLYGYMIEFGAGAKESFGQVTMTAGQTRLVATRGSDAVTIFPHAIISQADPEENAGIQRWRLDAPEVVITSVGGASTINMGFEFLVPTGYQPEYLYVKNVRKRVDRQQPTSFDSPTALVSAIGTGALGGGTATVGDIDKADAQTVSAGATGRRGRRSAAESDAGIAVSDRMGFAFRTTQKGGLELNDENQVIRGENAWFKDELTQSNQINRDLRVDTFATGADRALLQIDVSPERAGSVLGRAYRTAQGVVPPQVIDTNGTPYQAIGYIYEDDEQFEVRLTPGNPIRGLTELPRLASARRDQRLTLLFYVTEGAEIDTYALGNKAILDFDPPIRVE